MLQREGSAVWCVLDESYAHPRPWHDSCAVVHAQCRVVLGACCMLMRVLKWVINDGLYSVRHSPVDPD